MSTEHSYLAVGKQKREQRASKIPGLWRLDAKATFGQNVLDVPSTCGVLTSRELEITGTNDALDILRKIRDESYTAEEVTRAFCKRAAVAQQVTNCLTEIFFDEAIARAQELDRDRAANPEQPLRPLHGVPISLKDSFRIPGYDSTTGLICWANQPGTEYSALPVLLLDLGAVLYCKTNVPQTMMTADSDNNVFGRTLNPANAKLTAGGSTGGEGALIAMRGSVLGVGTDIAGSIRIPSVCNGIYGFRPSSGIIPEGGQRDPAPSGLPGILPVAGPLASSLRSATYFTKVIMQAEPWRYDHSCNHIPWKAVPVHDKIRVGLFSDDGLYTPWPPIRRTIKEVAARLEQANYEIIPLRLPHVQEALNIAHRMYALDGCKYVQDLLKTGGEPPVESVSRINLAGIPSATLDDLLSLNTDRSRIEQVYHKLWLDNKLDAMLLPGAPTTATPFDTWGPITYTALWNLLDYPAIIIPTGKVQSEDVADAIENAKYGEADEKNYKLYTGPQDFADAPLAVQVVGMRQEDESLLHIAGSIDAILNNKPQLSG
ncbi:general amidase like protein [Zymoseptoria brevis]|uniref:General amidase like protein n=1 Tax=Zymoseptoria brevis TaxID=1047168 RepID=A0A0F4GCZ8_9PEZI|nr:general amidase like protein [Zymoseptoria brevis]